jgi:hypothetical protein
VTRVHEYQTRPSDTDGGACFFQPPPGRGGSYVLAACGLRADSLPLRIRSGTRTNVGTRAISRTPEGESLCGEIQPTALLFSHTGRVLSRSEARQVPTASATVHRIAPSSMATVGGVSQPAQGIIAVEVVQTDRSHQRETRPCPTPISPAMKRRRRAALLRHAEWRP